jgi:hypothetical protein
MICILVLSDGRWVEKELLDEFLTLVDQDLTLIQKRGGVVINLLDEDTEIEREYDCKDILLDYMYFVR